MTITICHDKPPDRKCVDDFLPRRDGPEKLSFLPLRREVVFFGSRPAEMN